jgi:16S rRNA (adenine1518-N6/adenine1519-N6)-dimethyltransferase
MVIKGSSFYPPPAVDSRGIILELKDNVPDYSPLFYPLVRALFSSRRKTIKNNLLNFLSSGESSSHTLPEFSILSKKESEEIIGRSLEINGIDPMERSENLDVGDFRNLAADLEKKLKRQRE